MSKNAHNPCRMLTTKQALVVLGLLLHSCLLKDAASASIKTKGRTLTDDDSFIVEFKPDLDGDYTGELTLAETLMDLDDDGLWVEYRYEHLFQGVSLRNASDSTIATLKSKDFVQSVTPDTKLELDTYTQDHPLNWGLDRIDQKELPMNGSYKYHYSGLGTEIYILDTGLYMNHQDLSAVYDAHHRIERTVRCGYDVFGGVCEDEVGHGTYVAGIAAGIFYGVAKKANLVAVKIYNRERGASIATALQGFEYVLQEKLARKEHPMVINFSLSGVKSSLLNKAVDTLTTAGVAVVVSAGNRAGDSCSYSPASSNSAIVVSAADYKDSKPSYANFGSCVTLYAPGHQIPSAWTRNHKDKAILSGTSAASAHVAGVAAQYLQAHRDWKWDTISAAITSQAANGTITNGTGEASEVKFLHNGILK